MVSFVSSFTKAEESVEEKSFVRSQLGSRDDGEKLEGKFVWSVWKRWTFSNESFSQQDSSLLLIFDMLENNQW